MKTFTDSASAALVRKFSLERGDPVEKFIAGEIAIKQESDEADAVLTATLSETGVMDSDGDIIMPGAFDRSLKQLDRMDMRFMHDRLEVVGVWQNMRIDDTLLRADGTLYTGTGGYDTPRKCLRLGKSGQLRGVSIGFRLVRFEVVIDEIRTPWGIGYDIYDLELREASLVDIPANPSARIDPASSDADKALDAETADVLARFCDSL